MVSTSADADRPRTSREEAKAVLYERQRVQRYLHVARNLSEDQHADASRPSEDHFRDTLRATFQPEDTQDGLAVEQGEDSGIAEQRYLRCHKVFQLFSYLERGNDAVQDIQRRATVQK